MQPANAEVFIDGERWDGPADDERLIVQLSPGTHRLEIQRDGYRTYDGTITVTPGQTTTFNVSLSR